MRILKQNPSIEPKVSFILVDWSVRESFHLLHYLRLQNTKRKDFEVIIIEYYSTVSEAIEPFKDQVDQWVLLEMPDDLYYHKHLMYNVGIFLGRGRIVVIIDSDAMINGNFINAVIQTFESQSDIVLHFDEFRNISKEFYPFNFPEFDDVTGKGCLNHIEGKTSGILDIADPLHTRNYGACMCAKRSDLIRMGGADEDIRYLGHICGPYEMTFRLVNMGLQQVWHQKEFIYHTWHPGQAGVGDYTGPHDGQYMSTMALDAIVTGRVRPYVENRAISALNRQKSSAVYPAESSLINKKYLDIWKNANTPRVRTASNTDTHAGYFKRYKGFRIEINSEMFCAYPLICPDSKEAQSGQINPFAKSGSPERIEKQINKILPVGFSLALCVIRIYFLLQQMVGHLKKLLKTPTDQVSKIVDTNNIAGSLAARFHQLKVKVNYLSEIYADLFVNLHLLKKNGILTSNKEKYVLVIEGKNSIIFSFLLKLMKTGNIVKVIRMNTWQDFLDNFEQFESPDMRKNLILSRDLYAKYYPLMSSSKIGKQVYIV